MNEPMIPGSPSTPPADDEDATQAPLPTFDALPLSPELRQTLEEMGYAHPTPVQLAVWEPATRGRDAVVQARTGTGKTASFGLPIVDHIVKRSAAHVQVLALCPTRELALQVAREIERLGAKKGIKVVAIYGGAPMPRQVEQIADGAQVVVGTPGRVLDHLRRKTLDPSGVKLMVLDESDEMLSMGFERELNAILEHLPAERQTLLFSATVPPDIERIAKNKLRSPEFLTLSGDHIGALEIDHFVYMIASDKLAALQHILEVENPESAILFCNTKDETERVSQALSRQGFDSDWLNGDLPQGDREKVMAATREGRLRFLVATDVAARGIDVSHVTHVINYDFPQDAESYVHRTGRTGRAGRTGTAISLIAPRDIGALYLVRLTYKIRPIEKQIPSEGERKTRAEADIVNLLAEAFLPKGIHPEDLALARRVLSHDEGVGIVAGLLRDHLGARPTLQDEASAARRAPRARAPRAPVSARRSDSRAPRPPAREERPEPPREREAPPAPPAQQAAPAAPLAAPAAPLAQQAAAQPQAAPAAIAATSPSQPNDPRDEPRRRRPRRDDDDGRRARGPRSREADRPVRGDEPSRMDPPKREGPLPTQGGNGPRHADFATWQPPEEEGDDQPILGGGGTPIGTVAPPGTPWAVGPRGGATADTSASDADFVEIYVNVGRREGARASDLQAALQERGQLGRDEVRRIRVRERNAFVSVRKELLARAVEALTGATIAGKTTMAEQARERSVEGEGDGAAREQVAEKSS